MAKINKDSQGEVSTSVSTLEPYEGTREYTVIKDSEHLKKDEVIKLTHSMALLFADELKLIKL